MKLHDLTPEDVESYLRRRIEILGFIELRFRQGIRITQEEIETYYQGTLLPQYPAGENPPPLEQVSSRIEEILLQQRVNELFDNWLSNLRKQGQIEVLDPALETAGAKDNPGGDERMSETGKPVRDRSCRGEAGAARAWHRRYRRHVVWGGSGLALLVIVALVGLYFWASSSCFENIMRRRLIARIEAATGGRAEIVRFPLERAEAGSAKQMAWCCMGAKRRGKRPMRNWRRCGSRWTCWVSGARAFCCATSSWIGRRFT